MEASSVIAAMSDLRAAAAKHLLRNEPTPEVIAGLRNAAKRCAAHLLRNEPELARHFAPERLEAMLVRIVDEVVERSRLAA